MSDIQVMIVATYELDTFQVLKIGYKLQYVPHEMYQNKNIGYRIGM